MRKKTVSPPAEEASLHDDPHWWLHCTWQEHRNRIEDIHPILLEIGRTMGSAHLTPGNVMKLLNAKDPKAEAEKLKPDLEVKT